MISFLIQIFIAVLAAVAVLELVKVYGPRTINVLVNSGKELWKKIKNLVFFRKN